MPALDVIDNDFDGSSSWKHDYEANFPVAETVSNEVPLIHVLGATPATISAVFASSPYELVVSGAVSSSVVATKGTLTAESKYGMKSSLYFYAGRAYPRTGGIAIAFDKECEIGKTGDATPFDTGGLSKYIHVNFTKTEDTERDFVEQSRVDLQEWRGAFARFLAAYFKPLNNYWDGRPEQGDPEGIYSNADNTWPAWTFEVHFECNQSVSSCVKIATSEPVADELFEIMKNSADDVDANLIATVASKLIRCDGDRAYIRDMESWVKSKCQLAPQ